MVATAKAATTNDALGANGRRKNLRPFQFNQESHVGARKRGKNLGKHMKVVPRFLALGGCCVMGEEAARECLMVCVHVMRRLLAPTTWFFLVNALLEMLEKA